MTDFDRLNAQAKLKDALDNNNVALFREALNNGANPTRLNAENRSVFDTALSTHGKAKFVPECLNNRCDPNFINKYFQKAAINYAADSGDPEILRVLLDRQGVEVNRKYDGLTPLNSLAKNLKPNNTDDVSTCIQILLNYGACPNSCDSSEMTPLLYILQNKDINDDIKNKLISTFLQRTDLDLDTYRKGEARKLLISKYRNFLLPEQKPIEPFNLLLNDLQRDEENRFLRHYNDHYSEMSEDQKGPLLLAAIKGRHPKAFEELLLKGVNVDTSFGDNTAVEMAVSSGNHLALEKLLEMTKLKIWKENPPLVCRILRYITDNDFSDYQKCFELLLDSKRIDINETDLDGRSALHYAVGNQNKKAILLFLEKGADWGIRSSFGDLPLEALSADVLEEYFDSCITTNGRKSSDKDLEIIMDYKNFIPPSREKASKIPSKYLNGEMAAIAFIAESKDHRRLLSHPLITSFLFLKWSNYSMIFYLNFFIYLTFAVSLVTHTVLKFRAREYEATTRFFRCLSWIGLIYLILREGFQLRMSGWNYRKSFINWIEVALIVSTVLTCTELIYDEELQKFIAVVTLILVSIEFCLLIGNLPFLSISTHLLMLKEVLKTFLKSFFLYIIFVITFSLSFYISFHKTTQNKENSTDVLNGANSPIAAAGEQTNNEHDASDQDDFNKFQNPLAAFIKTIVMFTGEFDAGALQFKTYYNYLVFLIFVIFSVVLFNLLNGLAVSDTQAIKAQAELSGYICKANLLTRSDNVLAGKTSFLVRLNQICPLLQGLVRCTPSRISIFPNDNHRVMVPMNSTNKKTKRNPNNNVVLELESAAINGGYRTVASDIDDLESQKELLHTPCCCPCMDGKCSVMDGQTVKMALQVIQRKIVASREAQREQQQQRLLVEINEKLLNFQENFCCCNKKGLLQQQKVERVSRTVEAITDIPASGYSGELETVSEEKRVRDCPLNGL